MKASQTFKRGTSRNPTKHPSLLARCTAPFASKQRNALEQDIQLDEPFRQYYSGDTVKGAVHMNVTKSQRITHLVIRLHGFVKVANRAKLPGESISYDEALMALEKGRGRRGIEYFGNGFARLFEDETVLCGEGRVIGQYEFRFEMVLPSKGLPSGIDFEHGTISYLLTSTVTRPTTIAPTLSQHRKLGFFEAIDISLIPKPKAEMVSIDVGYKRVKARVGKKKEVDRLREGENSEPPGTMSGEHNEPCNNRQVDSDPPRSPVPSETSSAATTDSTSSNMSCSMAPPLSTVIENGEDAITNPIRNTISARIEVLQGGCLAGDSFPVKVSIKHNTVVKSMQGIIITLYRQGRIETHPAIPLGPQRRGEKPKYEDYYPKSYTGLGGLSLTSAGSSRSFRQDLNQIFAPIIVDPHSLAAVISTSIQAPVHLFPTITCVPGGMVSFRYYVEVVVDLRANKGGQDRLRPHLSMTSGLQHGYGDAKMTRIECPDGVSYAATPGFNYLVTDQLRRTKGVVFTRTEMIVGTEDSRKRQKQREDHPAVYENRPSNVSAVLGVEITQDQEIDPGRRESDVEESNIPCTHASDLEQYSTPNIPPPDIEDDLDEKGRLRRAEERLLPSAPPRDEEPSSSAALIPSAPIADDEEDFLRRYGQDHPAPAYDGPQDDKLERERQRLLARTSAPDAEDDGAEGASTGADNPRAIQPSAPVLYEDDVFDINDPRVPQTPAPEPNTLNPRLRLDDHESTPANTRGITDNDENFSSNSNENLPLYRR